MMSINGLVNAGPGSVGLGPGAGPGGAGMMAGSLAAGAHLGSGNNIEKISELLFNLSAIEVRDDFEEVRLTWSPRGVWSAKVLTC